MLEAIHSVVSNAPLLRESAEQATSARAIAANPERVQEVAKAPFVSPYIRVDVDFDKAVLQIRDSDTGEVVRQFPSQSALEAIRRKQVSERAMDVQTTQTLAGGRDAALAVDGGAEVQLPDPAPAPQTAAAPSQSGGDSAGSQGGYVSILV